VMDAWQAGVIAVEDQNAGVIICNGSGGDDFKNR